MNQFKPNDRIILAKNHSAFSSEHLNIGQVYIIDQIWSNVLKIKNCRLHFLNSDFKLVGEKIKNTELKFQVGDKVKLRKNKGKFYGISENQIYIIKEIINNDLLFFEGKPYSYTNSNFELVERNYKSKDYGPLKIKYDAGEDKHFEVSDSQKTQLKYCKEDNFLSQPDPNNAMIDRDKAISGYFYRVPVFFKTDVMEELNKILKDPQEWDLNKKEFSFVDILDITEKSAKFGGTSWYHKDIL